MPEGRIQTLTHRTENMVWQPRWLSHPNGALGLASVLIVVADLDEAAERFARFTGRTARPSSHGQSIDLDRGRVDFVTAEACTGMLPELPIPALPFITTYEVSVGSLDIEGDPVLPTCDAQNLLTKLQGLGFTGTATIANDGTGACL